MLILSKELIKGMVENEKKSDKYIKREYSG